MAEFTRNCTESTKRSDDWFDDEKDDMDDLIACEEYDVLKMCDMNEMDDYDSKMRGYDNDDDADDTYITNLDLIDADFNLFNSFTNLSPLFLPNELSSLDFNNHLSLFHLNCRSLPNKLSQFELFLNSCSVPFSVIGLSETWVNSNNMSLIKIPEYEFI